jgi:hypothetical protein
VIGAAAQKSETPGRYPRPLWIPRVIGSVAGALPGGPGAGGLQVQPSVPNALGSALVVVADATAALSAIAAVSKSLGINFGSR